MPSLYDRTFEPTEEEEPRRGPTVERAQAMRPSFRMSSAGRRAPGTGTSSMDRIVGLGEAAASMGTEMLSQVPAGVATMGALPFGVKRAANIGDEVSKALTYLPRSKAGADVLEALEKPMAAMGAPGAAAGEEVMRRTGSPLLATATEMVVQPLNLLAAPMVGRGAVRGARAAGRAAQAAGRELGPKAAEMAESYMRRSGMMPQAVPSAPSMMFDDALMESAVRDSRGATGLIDNALQTDAQGIVRGRAKQLDRDLAKGLYTENDVKQSFASTLDQIRSRFGDTVKLWRADAPDAEKRPDTRTVFMADEATARQYEKGGREAKPYIVNTDDILGVYARPSGYREVIVRRSALDEQRLDAEIYKEKLLATLPQMMRVFEKNFKGWRPGEKEMLDSVETGYNVMNKTGDVKQAGKAVMDELNALYRLNQEKGVLQRNEQRLPQTVPSAAQNFDSANINPFGIEPPHDVRDQKKLNNLVESMKSNGWQGRPILAYDIGRGPEALTGSHRIVAARKAGLEEIPVVMVHPDIADYVDDFGRSIVDAAFLEADEAAKYLKRFGDKEAADLMDIEDAAQSAKWEKSESSARNEQRLPQTDTPAFKEFTAGAPVIKADQATKAEFQTGKPVVIEGFSGTRRDFSEIDPAQSSAGYFLSSKPVVADEYAGVYPEGMGGGSFPTGGNIQRSFVRMDNPLFVNARGASFSRIDTRGVPGFGLPMSNTDMLNYWAKQQGYDGVIYKDLRDSVSRPGGQNAPASNVYVSFKPNYVKSAIGNRGTFDVQSRDMTKAQGGAVEGNMGYTQAADTITQRLMDQGMSRDQAFGMALRMADAHMKAGGAVMMGRGGSPKRAPGVKSTSERAREQQAKRAEERAKKAQEEAARVPTMPPIDRAAYEAAQALGSLGVRVMPDAMKRRLEANTNEMLKQNPKLSLEEAAARAQRQAVQQLRWERSDRPAAQKKFGDLSPSTYDMPAQRRLRNLPEAVRERTEKAQAFLAQPTEPWKPPPGDLQAFDRERIKDALEGFPGVEQSRFPRYQAPRAQTDYVSEIYDDPVNRELIKRQIARGLPLGGETFYASLYPVKLAAMERGISPEKFDQFVYETAPASARNSILNEMAVGQFLRDMKARGLPLDEETVKAERSRFKQKYGMGLPLMPVHREGVRQVIEEGRNLREMSKADIPTNYKIPTYGTQKAGDFGKSMTLDVHEAAGQTQASRYHPYFTKQGGFGPTEYGLAEGKMLDIAQEMGIPGGMAQAGRWFGGGELTGLKSPRGDALDLLERQTAYTLQGQGINPTPKAVRDYVLNMIETGEGVLMPYFKDAPIPDVRTRKAEGGEVTLRKGGRAVKGQSNAERARMAQQARQAARARTATAVAPHEYIPGAGVGLGESKVNAPLPVRQAYSQEISNVFKDQRDVDRLQKALGLAPAPTRAGTGAFRPSGGIPFQGMVDEPARTQRMPLETQPAFATAAKVPLTRKGDDIEQSAKDKLAAAEAMRGYMTGQHGSTYNVQIPRRGGESMFVPLPKPADPDLMRLAYQMLDEDAFLADTGRGVNVLFNPYKDNNKPMTSAQRRRLKQYLGGSTTMPTKNVSDYIDFSEAWLGQQGSGAATKQMLERLEPLSAKDRAALSQESQDIAGGLYDIFTRESGKEPYRVDVMNALRVLRDKGIPGLTAALAAGEALPSE